MHLTRRQFTKTLAAATAGSSLRSFAASTGHIRLGLNTYSLRTLPHDTAITTILRIMKEQQLEDCELRFAQVEPEFGPALRPPNPAAPPTPEELEQRKAATAARTEWRLSAPLSQFENIRSSFHAEGLRIKAYAVTFTDSEAELDRLFLMTKALGAESIIGRVPEAITGKVVAAADKHRLNVGIQFSDIKLLTQQLQASPYMRADPDTGDLTKAKIDALQFIAEHDTKIDSVDLKDAVAGVGSVPFGEGNANLPGVVQHLRKRQLPITAYIDCDYPGTGASAEEVARCVSYIRSVDSNA